MKKLILSLAALAFATLLFSQGDSNDAQDTVKQNEVLNTQSEYIAQK
jgi:hypothetical protein